MGKRFLVIGDYVRSNNDGQMHYISAQRLAELYGVDPAECIFKDKDHRTGFLGIELEALSVLRPQASGDYSKLPKPSIS